jgi:DNA-binding MarR family transcriptional regulator
MAKNKPASKKSEKTGLADIFTRTTLRLLEFLIFENDDRYYSLSDIAEKIGVSVSSVSRSCKKLLKYGILVEDSYPRGRTGRPIKLVELDYGNPMVDILVKWLKAFNSYLSWMEKTKNTY